MRGFHLDSGAVKSIDIFPFRKTKLQDPQVALPPPWEPPSPGKRGDLSIKNEFKHDLSIKSMD